MKIAILQCDSVKLQFQGKHGDYPMMIEALFRKVLPTVEFNCFDVTMGHYPDDIGTYDLYVTTGSKASVYDDEPWIATLQAFIVKLHHADKKLLAICFGHQLVAQAFGGKVEKSDKGWGVGVHTMQVVADKSWLVPAVEVCSVLVSHQDQVIELPKGAELIAATPFCPNAMFQLGDNIVTIQGHPEFNKPYAKKLMEFRRELLGGTVYHAGIESLQKQTDEQTIARWAVNFIADTSSSCCGC